MEAQCTTQHQVDQSSFGRSLPRIYWQQRR